jgi:nitric oxide reductase NorE protein
MRIDDLPGELLMWVLIVSEVLVFAAGITSMAVVRLFDPQGFAAAQGLLDGRIAAFNTVTLVTSGLFAARAERAARQDDARATRRNIALAILGGLIFLAVKVAEYAADLQAGISFESHPFFMFYFLLTGFHAAHVIAGVIVLGLVAIRAQQQAVQAGAAFWHMVDLVWVLILPPIYLLS